MYMYSHTQFSGANPERLVAAIKYFLQGKGAEKGLRWEEGRKDGGRWEEERRMKGGGRRGEGWREGGRKEGGREVGDEGIDVLASMNIFKMYTVERRRRRRRRRRRDRAVEKGE